MTHFVGLVILPKGTKIEKCGYDSPGIDEAMYGDRSKGEPMFKMSYDAARKKFDVPPSPTLQEALTAVLAPYDENKEVEPYPEEMDVESMVGHYTSPKNPEDDSSYGQLRYKGKYPPYKGFDWKKKRADKIWLLKNIVRPFAEDWNGSPLHEYPNTDPQDPNYNQYEYDANVVAGVLNVRVWLTFGETEDEDKFWYWRTYNPKSEWDWYSIGGRWHGYFFHKAGKKVNMLRIKDIDWEAKKKQHEQWREEGWAKWKEACLEGGYDPDEDPGKIKKAFERARELGNKKRELEQKAQEGVRNGKRMVRNGKEGWSTKEEKELAFLEESLMKMRRCLWEIAADDKIIGATKEEYCYIPDRPVPCGHIIINGEWTKRWSMGWWGSHGEGPSDEEWSKQFYGLLDACDPDSVVVAVDFHI